MTVLHHSTRWLPRTQTWIYNQIKYLPHEITRHIVCENVDNLEEFWLPNIHCLADLPKWRTLVDRHLRARNVRHHLKFVSKVARETSAQILHSHFGPNAWANIGVLGNSTMKHVVSFYGYDVTLWPRQYPEYVLRYHELFDNVAAVFCEGPAMAQELIKLGCPENKIVVQHLGIPLDRIRYRPRSWRPGTPLRVLISATFKEKKGIPYALRALGAIRGKVDLQVTIMGDAGARQSDREEKAKIESAIEECGLSGETNLLGFQPYTRVLSEAEHHHIFISPSITASNGDTEGGAPVSIIEMAASGMPIVSSYHCDIPEVVLDGRTGWLAPEKDWRQLTEHLLWLIRHPGDWRPYLDAARKHIEEEYDCRVQGRRLSEHYHRFVGIS